jgi:hypothetical protein
MTEPEGGTVVKERVQAAVVILFVLAIAGVVVVLLMRVDREAPVTKGPSATPSNDPDSAAGEPIGRVSLIAGRGDLVVRVMAGSCADPGGPKLEVSENRGRSFRRIPVPQVDDGSGVSASSPQVRAIAFAEARSRLAMTVAAADDNCDVRRYTTSDGGGTWAQEDGEIGEWYVDPKSGGVVSPTGPTDAGCSGVVSLAPVKKSTAKVFCDDGTIRGTIDRGATWLPSGQLANVTAAVFTGPQTGYAAVSGSKCRSRIYSTINGGLSWTPQGCVIKEFAIPALTGTNIRLVAGGSGGVRLSANSGRTWKPSTMK